MRRRHGKFTPHGVANPWYGFKRPLIRRSQGLKFSPRPNRSFLLQAISSLLIEPDLPAPIMSTPSRLLVKLSQRLFTDEGDRAAFVDCLIHPKPFAGSILWCRERPAELPFAIAPAQPWQPAFVDRLTLGQKPGQHPLHDQGAFYCLDFSSVFAIAPIFHLAEMAGNSLTKPPLVIDVCAAPGGKSIFAGVALQPRWLISNEVIGKRIPALLSNLKRCQIQPALVSNLDSKILAQSIPKTAAIALVDAPCTGQSLLAKGGKAPGCFHPVTINNNANRQKRILANSAQLVAPQGYLVYMTCTYSVEENEQVADWFLDRFPHFQPITIPALETFQSPLSDLACYRIFPQGKLGAGAFTILFQNTESGSGKPLSPEFFSRPGVIKHSERLIDQGYLPRG